MMMTNIRGAIVLLFLALPFFNLFNYKMGQISLYYILVIVFIFKYFKFKKHKFSKSKICAFIMLVMLRIPSGDFALLAKWSLLLFVVFITYNEDFFVEQIIEIINGITISTILSSLFGYYMLQNHISIYTRSYVYSQGVGSTTRFAGLIGDSVFYAQFVSVLIAANLVVAFYKKEKIKRSVVCSIILVLFDLMTYSKTGIILIVGVTAMFAIALVVKNAKKKSTIAKAVGISMLFVVAGIYAVNYVIVHMDNLMILNYITRFTSADLTTGRNIVAKHYLDLLYGSWRSLFFAMPQELYTTPFSTNGVNQINRAHNIYIESVCAFGLIASLILFVWLVFRLFRTFKMKDAWFCCLPLLVILASGFALHGHFEFHYYSLIALSLCFVCPKIKGLVSNDIKDFDRSLQNGC